MAESGDYHHRYGRPVETEGASSALETLEPRVSVGTEDGLANSFAVTGDTLIKLEHGVIGTLADLQVGLEIKVRFESRTDVAIRVELED